jgi:hypothetical protein
MNPESEILRSLEARITHLEQINTENQELLQSINRTMKFGRYMQLFYIILIVGGTFGVYTVMRPFIGTAQNSIGQIQDLLDITGSM